MILKNTKEIVGEMAQNATNFLNRAAAELLET